MFLCMLISFIYHKHYCHITGSSDLKLHLVLLHSDALIPPKLHYHHGY